MRRTCSVKCDWNMTLEWTLNVQENILSTFCFSLQFLYRDKTLRVCFLSSFFPKFWRGQIVPLTIFLRDNFNCSAGLAQWRGLAQTLRKEWRLSIAFFFLLTSASTDVSTSSGWNMSINTYQKNIKCIRLLSAQVGLQPSHRHETAVCWGTLWY